MERPLHFFRFSHVSGSSAHADYWYLVCAEITRVGEQKKKNATIEYI